MAKKVYLVDTENVGAVWKHLFRLAANTDDILLFYTENTPFLSYNDLEFVLSYKERFTMIKCYTGNNALDFQLVSYLGFLMKTGAKTQYIIVSNDTGYDAMIRFWGDRDRNVSRLSQAELIRSVRPKMEKTLTEEVSVEKASKEKNSKEKTSAGKASVEKVSKEKISMEKASTEKSSEEKVSTGKTLGKQENQKNKVAETNSEKQEHQKNQMTEANLEEKEHQKNQVTEANLGKQERQKNQVTEANSEKQEHQKNQMAGANLEEQEHQKNQVTEASLEKQEYQENQVTEASLEKQEYQENQVTEENSEKQKRQGNQVTEANPEKQENQMMGEKQENHKKQVAEENQEKNLLDTEPETVEIPILALENVRAESAEFEYSDEEILIQGVLSDEKSKEVISWIVKMLHHYSAKQLQQIHREMIKKYGQKDGGQMYKLIKPILKQFYHMQQIAAEEKKKDQDSGVKVITS